MLTITQKGTNRVDIDLSGEVTAEIMATALDDLIAKSENVKNGRMLYRIPVFAMPSLSAFGVEMTRLPKLFGLLGKYDRCAVLTDIGWLRTAAEIEGAIIPGLTIKSFTLAEEEDAEAWLAETS